MIRAELRWVLKMVDSGYSFKSAENIPQLLSLMDKENKIFPKMTLGRQKCGYYVTHALYPFHFEALIKRILEVPAYTLGVDGGSFRVRGLKKMIDIVIRWFYFSQYCLITSSGTGTSQGVRGVRLLTSFVELRPFSLTFTHFFVEFCRDRRLHAFSKILASCLFSLPAVFFPFLV